ncbi:MAG TPA: TIM barrel protein [Acidimicrobiales bacterium]|nr:TIM barrel protein [Acidimicrobiales bacterium]
MTKVLTREDCVVNCSILFGEYPLRDRPSRAFAAGFRRIELWWPFASAVPGDSEIDRLCSAIEDAGVQLYGLNLFAGDMAAGERGILSAPARSAEYDDNLAVVASIATRLGCRTFNALYGNRLEGVTPDEQDEVACERLREAAAILGRAGGRVLVEPLSGGAGYPLRLAADAVRVIERAEAASPLGNVFLLADLYHLAVNGDDVSAAIRRFGPRIGHVQIADAPGRHEPGTGGLPLARWIGELQAAGYEGPYALEYHPSTRTEASFGWLARTAVPRRSADEPESLGPSTS